MTELIKITERSGQQVVSARELHEFLEVKTAFTHWVNRMKEYGFNEGEDFMSFLAETTIGRPKADFALTMDTAKEWSMLQRNDKGKQARQYFIRKEKESQFSLVDLTSPDTIITLAQNWKKEQELREKAEKQVKRLAPKAELMDKVLDADEKIDIGQAAKILELPYGRNTLFKKLKEAGVFFKNRNEPKQQYIARGLFVMKEKYIERTNHEGFVVTKTLVTQKGLEFLNEMFGNGPRDEHTLAKAS